MLLWFVGIIVAGVVVVAGWGRREASRLAVRRYVVESSRLPAAFDRLLIAHLSDIHFQAAAPVQRELTARMQGMHPDLILFTGDLLGTTEEAPLAADYLATFRAPLGTIAVLGNHDHRPSLTEGWLAGQLRRRGVTVLCNENLVLERNGQKLWIVGVDDPHRGLQRLDRALQGTPSGDFRILLTHTPGLFRQAVKAGIDLLLAGHTHGGQIRAPKLGPLHTNTRGLPRAYADGLTRLSSRTTMIVSRGIGLTWFPIRLFCRPEIVLLELRRSAAAPGGDSATADEQSDALSARRGSPDPNARRGSPDPAAAQTEGLHRCLETSGRPFRGGRETCPERGTDGVQSEAV